MTRGCRTVVTGLLLGTSACGPTGDSRDLTRDVDRATAAVAREAAEQRDGAQRAIEEKLAELNREIERARRLSRAARHARDDAERQLAALERESRELRVRLEQARMQGARAWTDVERAIDRALQEVERKWGLAEDGEGPK